MILLNTTEEPNRDSTDVVALTDYLLNRLLAKAPASLRADSGETTPEIIWNLDTEHGTEALYETKRWIFRSILARIGFYYMNQQLYGGESIVALKLNEREYVATFRMRNSTTEGLWVDIAVK